MVCSLPLIPAGLSTCAPKPSSPPAPSSPSLLGVFPSLLDKAPPKYKHAVFPPILKKALFLLAPLLSSAATPFLLLFTVQSHESAANAHQVLSSRSPLDSFPSSLWPCHSTDASELTTAGCSGIFCPHLARVTAALTLPPPEDPSPLGLQGSLALQPSPPASQPLLLAPGLPTALLPAGAAGLYPWSCLCLLYLWDNSHLQGPLLGMLDFNPTA